MTNRHLVSAGALATTVALLAMSGSPALAADPVARASASGAVITAGGQQQGTGTYAVTNDGSTERATGSNQPQASLLGGQKLVQVGTLAQDARTTIVNGQGISQACAGAAGPGASVVGVSGGVNCLGAGAGAITIDAGTLDISGITLVDNPALAPLNQALQPILAPVGAGLNTATTTLLQALGNPSITAGIGAAQSRCQSDPTSASGTANLADAGVSVNLPAAFGGPVKVLTLPANPAPNTKVVADLDAVVTTVLTSLRASLNTTATGALTPLKPAIDAIDANVFATLQEQLVDGVLNQVSAQLAPLQTTILDGTLNKQTSSAANQIEVTAVDVSLLPVAGSNAIGLRIGTSTCGPNGRVAAPAAATTTPTPKVTPKPKPAPQVPTSVPAGLESAPQDPLGPWALTGLGALLAASVAAGATAYRRSRAR